MNPVLSQEIFSINSQAVLYCIVSEIYSQGEQEVQEHLSMGPVSSCLGFSQNNKEVSSYVAIWN